MNKERVLVTNGSSSKNFPFVVVTVRYMNFILEEKIEKFGFIPCHVLRTASVQVPHVLIFYQGALQKTRSSSKVWSPNKFGSIDIN